MKKIIIALVAVLVAWNAQAQIGIVAGVTSSSSNLKEAVADARNITQYHIGLTYKLGVGNFFAIQPSLVYNMKGTKLGNAALDLLNTDLNFKTGYLELPVQLQLGFGIGELARVYGIAEPFVGYAITNQVSSKNTSVKNNWDNVKNRLEYGLGLGVGAELFSHIQVSVRYFWNLGDVYGADINFDSIRTSIGTQKCNGIVASAAFIF